MSVVNYNSITLPYAEITRFDQQSVQDDLGGTDRVLTKFDISAQMVVHPNYVSLLAPDLAGVPNTDAAEIMYVIRDRLLKPRKQLSIKFNGTELIPQKQTGVSGTVDAKNGPVPQSVPVIALQNSTFLVQFNIIAHYWEKNIAIPGEPVGNSAGAPVLWNRWTESADIDNCQYTTRTRDGRFMIRSDNVDGFLADQLRSQMAVVGVPNGFLREHSNYSVSADGLQISYRVVDKEVFKMPPEPAHEADGEYIETGTRADALQFAEVRVRLRAKKNTPQGQLVNTAFAVAGNKLRLVGADITAASSLRAVLESSFLRIGMYDNYVEIQMRAMFAAGVPLLIKKAGRVRTPGSDGVNYKPIFFDRGNAQLLLQAAAYYDPSLRGVQLDKVLGQLTAGRAVGRAGKNPE